MNLRDIFLLRCLTTLMVLADTILKKYSSTVATIFTGIASAALFGHTLTMNFILGISIVFISMHQVFDELGLKTILVIQFHDSLALFLSVLFSHGQN